MLPGVAAQALHILEQQAPLPFRAREIAKSLEHFGHEGSQSGFFGRDGEGDVGGACQKFTDLLECRELRFVHVDHHPVMIDLKPELSASYPVGNTHPLSASYAIGRGSALSAPLLRRTIAA